MLEFPQIRVGVSAVDLVVIVLTAFMAGVNWQAGNMKATTICLLACAIAAQLLGRE